MFSIFFWADPETSAGRTGSCIPVRVVLGRGRLCVCRGGGEEKKTETVAPINYCIFIFDTLHIVQKQTNVF